VRAATWRAGRDGLSGKLVHPEAARLVPAREAVAALVDHVADALVEAGDREQVDALMAQMLGACGATRQRSVFEAHGSLEAVVDDLRARTESSYRAR
jgi:carboxylate-amine ligase